MKLVLEVDVPAGDAAAELGRIFRHWAGDLHHYQLVPGDGSPIYDAGYNEVGRWHIVGGRAAEDAEETIADLGTDDGTGDDDDTEDDTGDGADTAGEDVSEYEYGGSGGYARSDE
jgi:hypothetical protein